MENNLSMDPASPPQSAQMQNQLERPTLQVSEREKSKKDLTAPWQEAVVDHNKSPETSFFPGSNNVQASGQFTKVDGNVHHHYYNTTYHVVYGSPEGSSSHQTLPGPTPIQSASSAHFRNENIPNKDIHSNASTSPPPVDGRRMHAHDPTLAGYPPNSHIRASGMHPTTSMPAVSTLSNPVKQVQAHDNHLNAPPSRRASLEALTPIDQPQVQMSMYPRGGNLSQPELTTSAREALAQHNSQNPIHRSTRKKIDLSARQVPQVSPPAYHRPSDDDFFVTTKNHQRRVNHEYLKIHFLREGRLTERQALYILEQATNVFSREPNMVTVDSPVTICGDIHGQYYDLMQIFEVGGPLQDGVYVFLGNYVDQGNFGIECLLYLYALKLWNPKAVVLLRGNHECRQVTEYFNFKRECLHKYSESVYEACLRSFCALPLAALVDKKFFCVHGGLSPELMTLKHLTNINRFVEPDSYGLLCDLLWSDPVPNYGHENEQVGNAPALDSETSFIHNVGRKQSFFYTHHAVCEFLERNGLYTIVRGHQVHQSGHLMYRESRKREYPSVITLFSAPNHQDVLKNHGSILRYEGKKTIIKQYVATPHPYWLPDFADVFTWSLPFVSTQFRNMVITVLNTFSREDPVESNLDNDADDEPDLRPFATRNRREIIRKKILAVGRIMIVMQLSREESQKAPAPQRTLAPPSIKQSHSARSSIDGPRPTISSSRSPAQSIFPMKTQTSQHSNSSKGSRKASKAPNLTEDFGEYVTVDPQVDSFPARKQVIKTKIITMGKMQRMFRRLRGDHTVLA